jgi:hypothetical protein
MSTGYKIEDQEALHYVTFQIVNWVDVFTRQVYRDIVIDSLKFCQANKGLEIYAFVVMSNPLAAARLHRVVGKIASKQKIRVRKSGNYMFYNPEGVYILVPSIMLEKKDYWILC